MSGFCFCLGIIIKRTFHCPCRFRAVSAALHGTSRVRSHLPQANYIKLRCTMVSNPTLSASFRNFLNLPRKRVRCVKIVAHGKPPLLRHASAARGSWFGIGDGSEVSSKDSHGCLGQGKSSIRIRRYFRAHRLLVWVGMAVHALGLPYV